MTPAVNYVKKYKISYTLHEYQHHDGVEAFGDEVVTELGVSADQVYKTRVVAMDKKSKEMAVSIVPVSKQVDFKAVAKTAPIAR